MLRKRTISPEAAQRRIEDLCSRSEQCTYEIMTKLRRWGIASQEATRIIRELRQGKYIDDRRFAQAFVRDKFMFCRWGRRKIMLALTAKRISREIMDQAMESELADNKLYFRNLANLILAKARNMQKPLSYEDRQRLLRFGVARGYETSLVIKAIDRLRQQESSDDDHDDDE